MISAIGNSGARSAGPIGWPVPGCSTGGAGVGRSAWMLYHDVGIWASVRMYLTVSMMAPPHRANERHDPRDPTIACIERRRIKNPSSHLGTRGQRPTAVPPL